MTNAFITPWWVTRQGTTTPGVCVETASPTTAIALARYHETFRDDADVALEARRLPYPAEPRMQSDQAPGSNCPSFCWQPSQCAGKTSCPRPRACDD